MLGQIDNSLERLNDKVEALSEYLPCLYAASRTPSVDWDITVAHSKEDQEKLARERVEIINWISPLNFYLVQDEIFSRRVPNTGNHLLSSAIFTSWVATKGQTIWCHGIRMSPHSVSLVHRLTSSRHSWWWENSVRVRSASREEIIWCFDTESDKRPERP